ncbi:hypothetical protein ABQE93_23610 [Mycolicibacterium sp. XJ662]
MPWALHSMRWSTAPIQVVLLNPVALHGDHHRREAVGIAQDVDDVQTVEHELQIGGSFTV